MLKYQMSTNRNSETNLFFPFFFKLRCKSSGCNCAHIGI